MANATEFFDYDKDEYDNASHDYQLMIRRYYDRFVVKENSPDFLDKLSIKNIMRELSSKEGLSTTIRVFESSGTRILRCSCEPPSGGG